ncbi:pur operon repressor, partial [Streptococcus pneumoniae]|nr:pur operon repressor [Streptococcus pneumoniae]
FSDLYQSAKSSISEDLGIVKETFEEKGIGLLMTVPGASGGVKYVPKMKGPEIRQVMDELITELSQSDRLLPGGYLYMTDVLGNPQM